MNQTGIAVVVVGVVLAVTVAGGTVLVGAERTVLDSGYVTETFASEDLYDEVRAPFVASVRDGLAESGDPVAEETPPGIEIVAFDRDAVAESAATEAFDSERIDRVVEGIYGYLHGSQGRAALTLSLADVKEAYAVRVTDEAIRIDAAALADVGGETEGPMEIDGTTVERLRANESSYLETRADFRQSLPDGTDREALAERTKADIEPAVEEATADEEPTVTEAVIAIQFATVDALAGDLDYETYRERIADAEADLRTVAGDRVRDRVDERAPDSIALDGEDGPFRDIDDTRAIVGTLDTLVLVVPIVALGLVGLVYAVTRSLRTTARTTGWAVLAAAVICLFSAALARGSVVTDGSGGQAAGFDQVVGPLVVGFLDAIVVQSLLAGVVGVVLVGTAWVDGRGHLDGLRETLGFDPAEVDESRADAATEGDQQPDGDERSGDDEPTGDATGEAGRTEETTENGREDE